MINPLKATLLLLLSLTAFSGLAHEGGHDEHTINSNEARSTALGIAKVFVERDPGLGFGKLADSWNAVDISATKLHTSGDGYYIISVANAAEDKTLFVLMSTSGNIYDANFTGSFPKLNQ